MTDEKHAPDIEDEWLKEERLSAAAIMESGVYGIELDAAKSATKATLKIARALVEWRKELRADCRPQSTDYLRARRRQYGAGTDGPQRLRRSRTKSQRCFGRSRMSNVRRRVIDVSATNCSLTGDDVRWVDERIAVLLRDGLSILDGYRSRGARAC